eukprot:8329386-Pyramimonas_sp.AAC.1
MRSSLRTGTAKPVACSQSKSITLPLVNASRSAMPTPAHAAGTGALVATGSVSARSLPSPSTRLLG